jgi:hypothetical protein
VTLACALSLPLATHADNTVGKGVAPPKHKWTEFVQVKGQPEPVPAEWVSTPEGQFAHSIEIPNPVPKDSGYRWWWSAKKYFLHLCEKEAGEFVFKTAENVEGFLFMRPPAWPTDFDLKDRYKLEAPHFEARFQVQSASISGRGMQFVSPPHRNFRFYEEPAIDSQRARGRIARASDFIERPLGLQTIEFADVPLSKYAITWRGLRRPHDRESGIAGVEVIVVEVQSNEILGVTRTFGISGKTPNVKGGFWWLNAAICPKFYTLYPRPDLTQLYGFVSKVLVPIPADKGK